MPADSDDGLYVYALAGPGLPPKLRLQKRSLEILSLSGIDVVVERMRTKPEPTTAALQAQHAVVMALAARAPALLPARFGSLASANQLQSVVGSHRQEIERALDLVRGCRQMTIRVFGNPAPAADDAKGRESAASGTAFLQRRRERAHQIPPEVAMVRRTLGEVVKSERVERGRSTLRVTVFHLVPVDAIARYEHQAAALQSLLAPHQVRVSGPWPPFAFVPELF